MDAQSHADVVAIVVTYNSAGDIPALLDDLRLAATTLAVRVIVVDNDSADDTVSVVGAHPDVHVVRSGGNLGYAGGINAGMRDLGPCDAVAILNPDLRIEENALPRMLGVLHSDPMVGAVVPLIRDESGSLYPSLRHEPSIVRTVGDALFGQTLWRSRPGFLSEFDYHPDSYAISHSVDWATGAALLVRSDLADRLGPWNESFFLYSEETEYFRRVREAGYEVRFVPESVVRHRLGGSGTSAAQQSLLAVNRIRYAEIHHGRAYTGVLRLAVMFAELLRSYDSTHRRTLSILARRHLWEELPKAKRSAPELLSGQPRRGSVIIPAFNESAVIERTLRPLGQAAVDGFIELIVVCNGCTDDTAERARRIDGAHVIELDTGSKPLALNAGDAIASLWPRLYLDADIEITAGAVLAVLDRLAHDDETLAARPSFRYGTEGADPVVRSYYRARTRMSAHQNALWWAGVYGLDKRGHDRFGTFPEVTGDDKFVDTQFDEHEKAVVPCEPSVWRAPRTTSGLVTVLSRHHRGNKELAQQDPLGAAPTARVTALSVLRTVRGPLSAVDAVTYLLAALASRRLARRSAERWERDTTSRLHS